jgi:hypothetical protein
MKRIVFTASALALLSMGCGHHLMQPNLTAATAKADMVDISLPQNAGESHAEPHAAVRQPGDFVVYRFSGSYRDKPVTLSQRVIARDGTDLLVDMILENGKQPLTLRLRLDDSPDGGGELISVARIEDEVLLPFGVAAFEEVMDDVVLSADENDGELASAPALVSVGDNELSCIKTSYQVRVGDSQAVMHTLSSNEFAWGDLGGQIETAGGKLLYKAEIIDMGGPTAGDLVASVPEDYVPIEIDAWDLE